MIGLTTPADGTAVEPRSDKPIAEAANWLGLSAFQVRIAVEYYADYPAEIAAVRSSAAARKAATNAPGEESPESPLVRVVRWQEAGRL